MSLQLLFRMTGMDRHQLHQEVVQRHAKLEDRIFNHDLKPSAPKNIHILNLNPKAPPKAHSLENASAPQSQQAMTTIEFCEKSSKDQRRTLSVSAGGCTFRRVVYGLDFQTNCFHRQLRPCILNLALRPPVPDPKPAMRSLTLSSLT